MKKPSQFLALMLVTLALLPSGVAAHGEKALEPFIRMRTIQWYDVHWSNTDLRINDEVHITGNFHVAEDWPVNVPKPEATYLNIATPGPVFIRTERYLNGYPSMNSVALQEGGDYTFTIVLKARVPGRYHIHPFFNLHDAGAVVGPGQWVEVTGKAADFTNQVTLLNGETIDMETYGLGNALYWHSFWIIAGTAWLLWWLRRPLFIQRYKMLQDGQVDLLVTPTDKNIGKAILVGVAVVVLVGYNTTQQRHPNAIPLQAARDQIEPLQPVVNNGDVSVRVKKAVYRVPDRSMQLYLQVENRTDSALQIGEFAVANVRFMNPDLFANDALGSDEMIARAGLRVDDGAPIAPGETKKLTLEAYDAAWETQKLDGLIRDADSRMGGLLFLYDTEGNRHIVSLSSAVIPQYVSNR